MSSITKPLIYLAQCILQHAYCIGLDTVGLRKTILHFAFYQIQRTGIQNIARASKQAHNPPEHYFSMTSL